MTKGVLATDIFVDTLVDLVNNVELPNSCYAFLLDADEGLVMYPYEGYGYVDEEPICLEELEGNLYALLESSIYDSPVENKDYDGSKRTFFANDMPICNWRIVVAIDSHVINVGVEECNKYTLTATEVVKEQNEWSEELVGSAQELVKMSTSLKESTSIFSL